MTDNNIENNELLNMNVEMSAGEMLKNARTTGRRKREIPTIAKQLCIREEFLEALEEGKYTAIPEQVYILGFARNYAIELGLDPDEIVAKIKQEMGVNTDCAKNNDDETACAMPSIKEESWVKLMFVKAYQFVYQNWQWFAGALVLALAIVALFVFTGNNSDAKKSVNSNMSAGQNIQVVASNESADGTVADVVVDDNTPKFNMEVREVFGADNKDDANVVMQAIQESWVKVEDGRGNTVFSRVLVPGDVYYVPAGNKYKATFGNAGGVDVWVNGVQAPDVGPDHTRISGVSLAPEKLMAKK